MTTAKKGHQLPLLGIQVDENKVGYYISTRIVPPLAILNLYKAKKLQAQIVRRERGMDVADENC